MRIRFGSLSTIMFTVPVVMTVIGSTPSHQNLKSIKYYYNYLIICFYDYIKFKTSHNIFGNKLYGIFMVEIGRNLQIVITSHYNYGTLFTLFI